MEPQYPTRRTLLHGSDLTAGTCMSQRSLTPRSSLALLLTVAALLVGWSHSLRAQPQPAGALVIAWPVTIVPTWFDPAETPAQITPFAFLYALHDGLVRPLPGERMGRSLAASWTESPDGLMYAFTLRPHLTFHNGDPCTAEDVQFSFARYRGSGATELHAKVKSVEVVDPLTVRFHLHAPWPDFMTFYGTTATAAGLVMPKHYLLQVGEDGFKKHPIGLGPYTFISHVPGVELVLEAYEGYWRHVPHVKRLLMKGVPEEATRLAMLKKGDPPS
jgi:peptide/nickel transport system substrate-binding protein